MVFSTLILVYLVYHFELLCEGELKLESSGNIANYISIKSSCNNKLQGMTKPGIHVVGLGKLRAESVHVGFIEDFNRLEILKDIDNKLRVMASKFRYVGLLTNGGTHKKPALTRLRDDVALEVLSNPTKEETSEFSVVNFFKKYDMGKFLSVEHGCCRPYMMVHDVSSGEKFVEKIGKINSNLKHVINL